MVTFELKEIDNPFKISATLTDRIFKPEYSIINEIKTLDNTTFATITGSNKEGYFSTLLDGSIKAFITLKPNKIVPNENQFKVGDVVEVKINFFSPESGQVNLLLNHDKEEIEVSTSKSFTFRKEHFGNSVVEKKKTTTIERTHGIVVNTLANKLTSLNFHIGNDSNRDLLIHNGNYEIQSIFEIKTSASTQSIYTAVGQLLIYSISIATIKGLFIVLPDLLKPKIKDKLEELNIKPIYYSWHNDEPKFHNLHLMKKYFI